MAARKTTTRKAPARVPKAPKAPNFSRLKPGGFLLPAKVTIDYDNVKYFQDLALPGFQIEYLVLVTSQFGSRLVNVLGYGHQQGVSYPSDEDLRRSIEEKRRQQAPAEPK